MTRYHQIRTKIRMSQKREDVAVSEAKRKREKLKSKLKNWIKVKLVNKTRKRHLQANMSKRQQIQEKERVGKIRKAKEK